LKTFRATLSPRRAAGRLLSKLPACQGAEEDRERSPCHRDGRTDGRYGLLRGFERDEVSRARHKPEIQVGERLLYTFRPGRRLHGVQFSPPHHGGDAYRAFGCMGRRARLYFVRGPVSTEAGLYGVGPGEGADDRLERLRAIAVLVAHPMVIEVAHVQLGRVPVVADELVRPRQRVEVVVPRPALGDGLLGLVCDGRVGRIEQGKRRRARVPAGRGSASIKLTGA
jgi:hypothetical protein